MKKVMKFVVAFAVSAAFLPLGALQAQADTLGPENFEAFSTGTVNGQNGWSMTGAFDSAIADPSATWPAFGSRALRISDAVTSGGFGDQTFSPAVNNAAGEPGADTGGYPAGTLQTHYDASFDFGSTTPGTEQVGEHINVSPDRGDGARMSYVRIEDSPTGYQVFFADYQDTAPYGAVGSEGDGCDNANDPQFVTTQIGIDLSSSDIHSIQFKMQLIPGPHNDVVEVYIDGTLAHTGTSWEDYYRWCAESNPGYTNDNSRIVRDLGFFERGDPDAGNAGQGIFFDNVKIHTFETDAPIVSAVSSTPDPVNVPGGVSLTAAADDSTTGNSNITGAEYNVDGGSWTAMTATDGSFNSPTEGVKATVNGLTAANHTLCVRATDASSNTSAGTDCTTAHVLAAPTINIGVDSATLEGTGASHVVNIPVTLSAPSTNAVDVHFAVADGTAIHPSDYTATASGTLHWNAGTNATQNISVTVNGDAIDEPDQTVVTTLSLPVNATLGNSTQTLTITDDDAPSKVSISDVAVEEGNAGTHSAVFSVKLNQPSEKVITLHYTTVNGSASAGSDYVLKRGTVKFPVGQVHMRILVQVIGDKTVEPNEFFSLALSSPVNAKFADSVGQGIILNDD